MGEMISTIRIQRILIVLMFITTIIITFCGYKQELEIMALKKENESLKGLVEMQQSVIADLEENLKNK